MFIVYPYTTLPLISLGPLMPSCLATLPKNKDFEPSFFHCFMPMSKMFNMIEEEKS